MDHGVDDVLVVHGYPLGCALLGLVMILKQTPLFVNERGFYGAGPQRQEKYSSESRIRFSWVSIPS